MAAGWKGDFLPCSRPEAHGRVRVGVGKRTGGIEACTSFRNHCGSSRPPTVRRDGRRPAVSRELCSRGIRNAGDGRPELDRGVEEIGGPPKDGHYSYRRASTGSSPAALIAGYNPNPTPTASDTTKASAMAVADTLVAQPA